MHLFSPSASQALRALIYLARQQNRGAVGVREIAQSEEIPQPFLSKLLHTLRNHGIIHSTKGPGGGYALASPASEVRVSDVVEVFDGSPSVKSTCVLGLSECNDENKCPLHDQWKSFRENYVQSIASLTLSELAETVSRAGGAG